jgi:hypothetical protein
MGFVIDARRKTVSGAIARPAVDIGVADRALMDEAAVARDGIDDSGHPPGLDAFAENWRRASPRRRS